MGTWPVQVVFTNDMDSEAKDLVQEYDERAGIEPMLAEFKGEWGLEKVSSRDFGANAALLLLKGLARNVLRRLAREQAPTEAQRWRTGWLRRLLIQRPARLVRHGRRVVVRLGGLAVDEKREKRVQKNSSPEIHAHRCDRTQHPGGKLELNPT